MNWKIAMAAALLPFAHSTPALAQEAPAAAPLVEASPHEQLFAAMQTGIDLDQVVESQLQSVRAIWEADPEMILAEREYPGLMTAMIDATRPLIRRMSQEAQEDYAPRMIEAMRTVLNDQEALDAVELYRSPLGRKLLSGMSRNSEFRNSIGGFVENDSISQQDFVKDVRVMTSKVLSQFSDEELAEFGRMATAKPSLLKLGKVQEAVLPIRLEIEQAALTPERQAEIDAAIEAAVLRHIAGQ